MRRHCRLLTQKQIFSPAYYYEVGTSGNAMKCCIISAGLSLLFPDQSVYFYMSNCNWNYKPNGISDLGISLSIYIPPPPNAPHVLVDFVVFPPGHGRSVTDF